MILRVGPRPFWPPYNVSGGFLGWGFKGFNFFATFPKAAVSKPKKHSPSPIKKVVPKTSKQSQVKAGATQSSPIAAQARQTLLSYLVGQIERYKYYPPAARHLNLEGVVNITVTVNTLLFWGSAQNPAGG